MADVSKFDLTKGAGSDSITTSEAQACAAALTIDYTSSKRVILYVKNADAAADAYVKFTAPTTPETGGVQRHRGDLTIKVDNGDEAVIDLWETARLLNIADKDIDVAFVDVAGDALAADILSDITVRAINL